MSRTPLVIFGTGDVARLAQLYFETDAEYDVVAFSVDRSRLDVEHFNGRPVVAFEDVASRFSPQSHEMFIAMGYTQMNRARAEKYHQAKLAGYRLASYVSSRCTFLTGHPVGDNCFILEDNTIQPFVRIGNNVTLWSGNHIGHDAVIEDHCFLTSHVVVSGHVRIGCYCFIGVNATLRNGITIAPRTLIGGGAVIMKDTVEGGVYLPPRSVLGEKRSDDVHP